MRKIQRSTCNSQKKGARGFGANAAGRDVPRSEGRPPRMRRVEESYEEWRLREDGKAEEEGWERISMERVIELTELLPEGLQWRWGKMEVGKRVFLTLTEPDGTRWRFRLRCGAWIKRCLL
jgi:hypothetical protein